MKTKLIRIGAIMAIAIASKAQVHITQTNVSCYSYNNGSACVIDSSSGNKSYFWSVGATSPCVNNLQAGTYYVTVMNGNNSTVKSVTITQPSPIIVSVTPYCDSLGGGLSHAFAQASGGTGILTYSWSNGQTGNYATGLPNGDNFLYVTDANGCMVVDSIMVNCQQDTTKLAVVTTVQNSTCGSNNGSVCATVSGGIGQYHYSWSTGSSSACIQNLTAGTYSLTVYDFAAHFSFTTVTITSSPDIDMTVYTGCDSVYGGGYAAAVVNNGTPPYTFQWSNGSNMSTQSGLANGDYYVWVYDANQCGDLDTIHVSCNDTASSLIAIISSQGASYCGDSSAFACVSASGGVQPYTYMWSNSVNSSCIQGVYPGTYTVTVTDANGMSSITVCSISSTSAPSVSIWTACDTLNGGGNAYANVSGGVGVYTYIWSTGSTTNAVSGLANGIYSLTVYDANGCMSVEQVTIACSSGVICNAQITLATAFGCSCDDEGYAVVAVAGGNAPYNYAWSNGSNAAAINNVTNGLYTVNVTDVNGCMAQTQVNISCNDTGLTGLINNEKEQKAVMKVYPNPSSGSTTLEFNSEESGITSVIVFDAIGNKVEQLDNGYKQAGTQKIQLGSESYSQGVYFVQVNHNGKVSSSKLIIAK